MTDLVATQHPKYLPFQALIVVFLLLRFICSYPDVSSYMSNAFRCQCCHREGCVSETDAATVSCRGLKKLCLTWTNYIQGFRFLFFTN